MEPIAKIDESEIQRRAAQAVRSGDSEGLGALIGEVEQWQRDFSRQALEEDRLRQEAARELDSMKAQLAFLPEEEARTRHQELTFKADFHGQRAKACQQQGEALAGLLKHLRKESERLQGRLLSERLAIQARHVQEKLKEAKAALTPLLSVIEEAYGIVREVETFNQTSHTKIPAPSLTGDVGVVHRLGEIALTAPPEWQRLGHDQRRVRFVMPYKGHLPGDVVLVSTQEAEALSGWTEPA